MQRLGIGPQSSVLQAPCTCGCGAQDAACHGQCCALTQEERSIRQNSTVPVWRLSDSDAASATSVELKYDCVACAARDVASTGADRSDILTIMPDGRIVVLDAVVTHSSALNYVRRARPRTPATRPSSVRRPSTAPFMIREFAGNGTDYWSVPLGTELYGRPECEPTRFLGELEHVAADRGQIAKMTFKQASYRRISTDCAYVHGNARVYNKAAEQIVRQ